MKKAATLALAQLVPNDMPPPFKEHQEADRKIKEIISEYFARRDDLFHCFFRFINISSTSFGKS